MNKTIWMTGALFGLLAVVLGAMGAHALKDTLPTEALESFRTGVQYQMYHALFLLFLGAQKDLGQRDAKIIFRLITAGVLCFSFSIYALSTQSLTGLDFSSIALITPVGGALLISGWLWLLYRVFRPLA